MRFSVVFPPQKMDLKEWVSDRLHSVIGMSDRTVADYLISLGKSSGTADRFVSELRRSGAVTMDGRMESFCEELWQRLPRKAQPVKAAAPDQMVVKEMALMKKNQAYRPMLSDDDEPAVVKREAKEKKGKSEGERKRHERRRDRKEEEEEDDGPAESVVRASQKRWKSEPNSEDELDKEERMRQEDVAERDKFANRMKVSERGSAWLIDWSIELSPFMHIRLIDWLIDWMYWLIDWLIDWLFDCSFDWLSQGLDVSVVFCSFLGQG